MSPYADRVITEGPSVMLTAHAAQNFALALHELATNAAKYGALSSNRGHVEIRWSALKATAHPQFVFPMAVRPEGAKHLWRRIPPG
jgi:two-component sensor histidine kinase